jgi:hypothetical protein
MVCVCVFALPALLTTHAPFIKKQPQTPTQSPSKSHLSVLFTNLYLSTSLHLAPHNSDLLVTQRSSAESYNEDTSPTAGGGLTLQQQTQLLAILAGAGFQGGKQQEQGEEAEARPA